MPNEIYKIDPEKLAHVYLRLNGFFALTNFIIHRERQYNYRVGTDVDVCGVRFPNRREIINRPVQDDERVSNLNIPILVIGEVKTANCSLNDSWLDPNSDVLKRIVATTGVFSEIQLEDVVSNLRTSGRYVNENIITQVVCFGRTPSNNFFNTNIIQITWSEVLSFIYDRFKLYQNEKSNHLQWEQIGHKLWDLVRISSTKEDFAEKIIVGKIPIPDTLETSLKDYLHQLRQQAYNARPKTMKHLYNNYCHNRKGSMIKEVFESILLQNKLIFIENGGQITYNF